jgi:non-specific serine/threonine protein kinase
MGDPDITISMTPLSPGARLAQYELFKQVGVGGMGVVYLARDVDLERQVAIKLLKLPGISRDATVNTEQRLVERFLREARSAAKLNHPNVAAVYQIGRHEHAGQSLTFIAMEWLSGGSLLDHLRQNIFLEWRDATTAIRDAAAGLAAAHAAGIMHRDIKPSNLMRSSNGVVKLVDFGLARSFEGPSDLTQRGSILGTPMYLSPEQCQGEPATPSSDVYALGCTLYHLLTSRPPFEGTALPALLYQHVHVPLPDPRRLAPEVPDSLCAILNRAAAKRVEDRYASASEMLVELESALAGKTPPSFVVTTEVPARDREAPRNNLPAELTTFVGRQRELAQCKQLLRQQRLVTLTGAGGTGKTRLAVQTGRALLDEFPEGVWLIELAAVDRADALAGAVADSLGVKQAGSAPLLEQISAHLRDRHALLIIDNCEHLIDPVATLLTRLLTACPHLRVLATSRQALGCAGETPLRVPSLEVPDSKESLDPEQMQQIESMGLFLARAKIARPDFRLDAQNIAAVAHICRRLDGIPLAIELAAARLRVLAPQQIAQRLDDMFKLLTGGDRAALPRQHTLRALID